MALILIISALLSDEVTVEDISLKLISEEEEDLCINQRAFLLTFLS